MKKNISKKLAVGLLSATMAGCAGGMKTITDGTGRFKNGVTGTWNRTVNAPDENSTPQEIFCDSKVKQGVLWENVATDTVKGAATGAAIGGGVSILTKKSDTLSKILSFGGAGAAISAGKTLLETNSNYDRNMKDCLDYTKRHPEQWGDTTQESPNTFDR